MESEEKQEPEFTAAPQASIAGDGADGERSLRPLPPLEPGQLIGNSYRVLSLLGQGGMGSVYKVEHVFQHTEMALKTISGSTLPGSIWRRFEKEAKAASTFEHPNLIKVHDSGLIDDQQPYFVMDLVRGDTLASVIESQQYLSIEAALAIFKQCCNGLAWAHERGVVHRDIKPSNIMLTETDDLETAQVKILDFGIAKLINAESMEATALTRTGEVFGTPYYLSPEQGLGNAVDHRTDIYSLGCVLFEALTGLPPFVGESAIAIIMKHQAETAPPLREASLGREFPDDLEAVVAHMLEKDPQARYQDFVEVADDLQRIQNKQPVNLGRIFPHRKRARRLRFRSSSIPSFAVVAAIGIATVVSAYAAGRSLGPFFESRQSEGEKLFAREAKHPDTERSSAFEYVDSLVKPSKVTVGQHYFSAGIPNSATRIFHFPPSVNVGRIIKIAPDSKVFTFNKGELTPAAKLDAEGELVIENFHPFSLQPSGQSQAQSEILRRFRPDEICALDFEHQSINTSDSTIADITHLTALRTIELRECNQVTDASIAHLNKLPSLTGLDVAITSISTDGLLRLKRLRQLKKLGAKGFSATRLLTALKGSTAMTTINLRHSDMHDSDLPLLVSLPNLESLNASGTSITEKGLEQLSKLHNLHYLYIHDMKFTPEVIKPLKQLHLKRLTISMNGWSRAAQERLKQELKGCQVGGYYALDEKNFCII